jgi:hypothetical protein
MGDLHHLLGSGVIGVFIYKRNPLVRGAAYFGVERESAQESHP